jgi:hypothetical protein
MSFPRRTRSLTKATRTFTLAYEKSTISVFSPILIYIQRGGGGNVHKEKFGGHTSDPTKPSLIEKAKAFLTGKKKELTSKKESKTTT